MNFRTRLPRAGAPFREWMRLIDYDRATKKHAAITGDDTALYQAIGHLDECKSPRLTGEAVNHDQCRFRRIAFLGEPFEQGRLIGFIWQVSDK